jgi:flagellar motor switch protein FliN/FliY
MGTTEQAIASQTEAAVEPVAEASSVLLPELTPKATGQSISHLGLVLDVGVEVSAVIGQRHLTIEQILGVGPGTVIDLDRVAGEPVALQVNGKPIARAEIVVLDGRLGARVIEVLDSPLQRPDSTQPSEES